MATSTTITLTDEWVQLTDDAEDFAIQNTSPRGTAILKYASAQPDASAYGNICKQREGLSSAVFGQGVVWGRTPIGGVGTTVEVTK